MTAEQLLVSIKNDVIGTTDTIKSLSDAEDLHSLCIKIRSEFFQRTQLYMMPHYRGEQFYGWDIKSGIFRPPMNITDPRIAKELEQKATHEFENVINNKLGSHQLRAIFNKEKYGKDWDLLFQAQHAGVKTTLTDWSAEIICPLYFATEESNNADVENADGQLWVFLLPTPLILSHNTWPNRDTFYDMNPFDMQQTYLINVASYLDHIEDRIFEYRMFKQKGRFVISANRYCHVPLDQQDYIKQFIFRVKIPQEFKSEIRKELANRGVIRKAMYIDETPARQNLIDEININIFSGY